MSKTKKLTEDEWQDVRRIMSRSLRAAGSGYVPERHEQRLIIRAYKTDRERYGREHAAVKGEAVKQLNPLAEEPPPTPEQSDDS